MTPCSVALPVDSKTPPLTVFNVPPVIVALLLTATAARLPLAVMFAPVLVTLVWIARVAPADASSRSVLVTPEPFSVSVVVPSVPPSTIASITWLLTSARLPLPMTPVPWIVLVVLVRVLPLPSIYAAPPLFARVSSVRVPLPLSVTLLLLITSSLFCPFPPFSRSRPWFTIDPSRYVVALSLAV